MRLLVVSHACVTPSNQEFFARVQRRTGWELALVLPKRWRNEYGEQEATRWPAFAGNLLPSSVVLAGNIPLHAYSTSAGRAIKRWAPDAIFVHHEPYGVATFQMFRAARRVGARAGFYSAQNLMKRYPWPISQIERFVYSRAAFALPVSEAVAEILRGKGYHGELEVLPLGVDMAAFERVADTRPRDGLRLGYVGRLAAEKGIDTLLTALSLLPDPRVSCVIAGDGPARPELEALGKRLGVEGRIQWAGYVPHSEVAGVYGQMSVAVVPSRTVPSWKEQFGRVVIEALAAGRPVVASDSGELPNLLRHTGGGWTFPEGDAEALAEQIGRLLADPRAVEAAASAGAAAVRANYDLDVLADRFAGVVERSVSPPIRRR